MNNHKDQFAFVWTATLRARYEDHHPNFGLLSLMNIHQLAMKDRNLMRVHRALGPAFVFQEERTASTLQSGRRVMERPVGFFCCRGLHGPEETPVKFLLSEWLAEYSK